MIYRYFVIFIVLSLLGACNSSSDPSADQQEVMFAAQDSQLCQVIAASISCNGGYSYWINDITATNNNVLAMTGVRDNNKDSQQWVSFFNDDLSEKLAEIHFPQDFYADEHNAPAVLATDNGHWLVVRTGHNDTFEQGRGKLFTYLLDDNFTIVQQGTLNLDNGATYAQLSQVGGNIYLLTRDTEAGWGVFTSVDNGESWSNWRKIWRGGGNRYISMQGFDGDGTGNGQVIFNIGNHPSDKTQNIAYLITEPADNGSELQTSSGRNFDDEKITEELITSHYEKTAGATNIRLLDSANNQQNICHLYSALDPQSSEWQLFLSGHNLVTNTTEHYFIGDYSGVLGDSTYVNGAAIGKCLLDPNEQFDVFVANYDQQSKSYFIHQVFVDAQSGDTRSEVITQSTNQLYRPQYISELNYLMYNEALRWDSYQRWQADQKLIKLK